MKYYEFELKKAADILIKDMFKIKPGETFIITADTESCEEVVNATAASVFSAGGKPMVIWLASPLGVGKAADPSLPIEALSAALSKADAWIEYNNQWLLYSTPFEKAMENNKKLRYMCLVGMDPDLMVRNIGRIDTEKLSKFLKAFAQKNIEAKSIRVTSSAGTDVKFLTDSNHVICCDAGDASEPGIFMMPGQINVVPKFGSVNGTIVFEGSLTPPCGLLSDNITLEIVDGVIKEIKGGRDAEVFKNWLKSFDDPNMYKMAHIAYGFNPGAKLTGNVVEDERVWGCTEWGIGYVSPLDAPPDGINAKSHCDGICLNSTVWIDDKLVMENGVIVDEELKFEI